MATQVFLDSKFADIEFDNNGCIFYLADPVMLPSSEYEFLVSVPAATIPLSFWVIDDDNNQLDLELPSDRLSIFLPTGNRSIDELIAYVNEKLLQADADGWQASYDEARNRFVLSTEQSGTSILVAEYTTCGRLLGLDYGQHHATKVTGNRAVDLAGTSSIFIRSNLATRNRDPVSRVGSNILAKVHVSRSFNEIEFFSSRQQFVIADRSISSIMIYLVDDSQRQVDLHGADFSLTVEIAIRPKERLRHAIDYRMRDVFGYTNSVVNTPNEQPQPAEPDAEAAEPSDETGNRGYKRDTGRDRKASG